MHKLSLIHIYNVIKNFLDNGSDKGADSLGWNYYKFIGPEGSWNTIINDYKANDKLVQSVFFGAPTPTMSTNLSSMDKMQAETYVNIIMGKQEPDTFDDFVKSWKEPVSYTHLDVYKRQKFWLIRLISSICRPRSIRISCITATSFCIA